MYILRQAVIGLNILSLQTGHIVGTTTDVLVDDKHLDLLGYWCQPADRRHKPQILLERDVRQLGREGIIVNDVDVLSDPDDLIRLQPAIKRHLNLIGLTVVSESDQRIGRVENFSINMDHAIIQKLYVRPGFIKSLTMSSLTIDRSQIVDVQPKKVVVRDANVKARSSLLAPKTKTLHS